MYLPIHYIINTVYNLIHIYSFHLLHVRCDTCLTVGTLSDSFIAFELQNTTKAKYSAQLWTLV